jgi:hypothetical protein
VAFRLLHIQCGPPLALPWVGAIIVVCLPSLLLLLPFTYFCRRRRDPGCLFADPFNADGQSHFASPVCGLFSRFLVHLTNDSPGLPPKRALTSGWPPACFTAGGRRRGMFSMVIIFARFRLLTFTAAGRPLESYSRRIAQSLFCGGQWRICPLCWRISSLSPVGDVMPQFLANGTIRNTTSCSTRAETICSIRTSNLGSTRARTR